MKLTLKYSLLALMLCALAPSLVTSAQSQELTENEARELAEESPTNPNFIGYEVSDSRQVSAEDLITLENLAYGNGGSLPSCRPSYQGKDMFCPLVTDCPLLTVCQKVTVRLWIPIFNYKTCRCVGIADGERTVGR